MKRISSFLLTLIALLVSCGTLCAQVLVLNPGETKTVDFTQVHYLEKSNAPLSLPKVTARATLTLQSDGQTLVVKLQHLGGARNTALYAFDLGLNQKQALGARGEAKYSEFPAKATWVGPTDIADLTAGKGTFTFAARDAVVREISDFIGTAAPLPASFLQAGQQGCITIKLTASDIGKNKPLTLSPMAYFVVPDATAPTARRSRVAARLSLNSTSSLK